MIRPLHDRVLIRRMDADTKTKGGLIVPDTAKEKPSLGEVIATGPGKSRDNGTIVPMTVKAGDTVLFGKWSGTEVQVNGEELLIVREEDLFGVMED